MYTEITACRACGSTALRSVLSLGNLVLTGVFPKDPEAPLTRGPLDLVKCDTMAFRDGCGLVQLRQTYDPIEMYGEQYGYRSSLNQSMVHHLHRVAEKMKRLVPLGPKDLVVDIGSNDGTLLSFYKPKEATLVGIDPTATKFGKHYRPDIEVVSDFFSAAAFRARFGDRKARVVTSVAMFYDLLDPLMFMREVLEILDDDGVWCFEQSYLPFLLQRNAYDTICHEHQEYYALKQIKWMTDQVGLKIIDVYTNDVNGGSFAVTVAKSRSRWLGPPATVAWYLKNESAQELDGTEVWEGFRRSIEGHRGRLLSLLDTVLGSGASVLGYGASTKGNVILQYCGLGTDRIPAIAEINEDKFGCHTPGTGIPIISEAEARDRNPDYFVVFPWHFRSEIIRREDAFFQAGGRLIFPLPEAEIVSA